MPPNLITLQDLKSHYDFRMQLLSIGAAAVLVLNGDARRVTIIFQDSGGAGQTYVAPGVEPIAGFGFVVPAGGADKLEFWFPRHGPLTGMEWWATNVGGPNDLLICEILWK